MLRRFGFGCVVLAISAVSVAQEYTTEVFLPGSGLRGIQGIAFDADDRMFVTSVLGRSIHEVNTQTGAHRPYMKSPDGMADDLTFADDGTLFWTAFSDGKVLSRKNFGPTLTCAEGILGVNGIAFNAEGRLFVSQVFLGDGLWEIDPLGTEAPRRILQNVGGLNGIDFGPDGSLYGALWFTGQVVKVDVDTGDMEVVLEGLKVPSASKFGPDGSLWVLDSAKGHIVKVDVENGTRTVFPGFPTAMDNLAFDSKGQLWFTVVPENAIYRFDESAVEAVALRSDYLAQPADLFIYGDGDRELLYIADNFAIKSVDLATKEVTNLARNVEAEIQYPSGLYVNEENLIVTSWFSRVIQVLDRRTGAIKETYSGLEGVTDAQQLPNGDIIAMTMDGRIWTIEGLARRSWPRYADTGKGAISMVPGPEGYLYTSSTSFDGLFEVDTKRNRKRIVLGGLSEPEGMAWAPDGDLVVSEVGADRVRKVNMTTGESTIIASGIPMGMDLPDYLPRDGTLNGVAVASDGSVYVTSDIEGAIYKISPVAP